MNRTLIVTLAMCFAVGLGRCAANPPVVTIDSDKNFCINGTPTYLIGTIGGDAQAWQNHLKPAGFDFRFFGSTSTPGAHSVGLWELPDVFSSPASILSWKNDPGYLMWDLGNQIDGNMWTYNAWVGYTINDIAAKHALCHSYDSATPRPVGVYWGNVNRVRGSEHGGWDGYWTGYRQYMPFVDYMVVGDYHWGLQEQTVAHAVRMSACPVIYLMHCSPVPSADFGLRPERAVEMRRSMWAAALCGAKGIIVDRFEEQENGYWYNWPVNVTAYWTVIAQASREIQQIKDVLLAPGVWKYERWNEWVLYTSRKLGGDTYTIIVNVDPVWSQAATIRVPVVESPVVGEFLFDKKTSGSVWGVPNSTTISDTTKSWTTNQWAGYWLHVYHYNGSHEHRYRIAGNTATTITIQSGNLTSDGVAPGDTYEVFEPITVTNRTFDITMEPGGRKVIRFANATFYNEVLKTPAATAQTSNRRWICLQDYSAGLRNDGTDWQPWDAYGLAYDSSRRRLVATMGMPNAWPLGKPQPEFSDCVGANYVWEWDIDSGYYSGPIKDGMQGGGDPWPENGVTYADAIYDSSRQCVLLYDSNGEIYEWRGAALGWDRKDIGTNRPGDISHYAACYVPSRAKMFFVGGKLGGGPGDYNRSGQFDYEWRNIVHTFDGTAWELLGNYLINMPYTALQEPVVCWDTARNMGVIFGLSHDGRYSNSLSPKQHFQDTPQQTYEMYDTWSCVKKSTAHVPYVYYNYQMAFDPRTSTTLLLGGQPSINGKGTDIYEYNGTDWKRLVYDDSALPAQDRRRILTMAYDPDHQMMLMVDTRGFKIWGLTSGLETRVSSIREAKNLANGTLVSVDGKVVGRKLSGYFYMQEPDRSQGIRVVSSSTAVAPGKVVNVVGTVQTLATGEKQIVAQVVGVSGSTGVVPLAMNNSSLVGAGYAGLAEPWGPGNVGLLVRTFGKVTHVGADHVYVDDGSAMADNSGRTGVKVSLSSAPDPGLLNHFVSATGIASVEIVGGQNARVLLVSDAADLLTLL